MTITNRLLASSTLAVSLLLVGCVTPSAPVDMTDAVEVVETVSIVETEPAPQPQLPAVRRTIEEVSDGIYKFQNNFHNSLFMVTDEGVVLIDPINVDAAEWLKAELATRFNKQVTHVLYSHAHWDHAAGASVFDTATIISRVESIANLTPEADRPLIGNAAAYDDNGDGVLQQEELRGPLAGQFDAMNIQEDTVISGFELFMHEYRDVLLPTQTFSSDVLSLSQGGRTVEMHHVGGNHATDLSYVYFPEERLVFVVDVISLGSLPFSTLPWFSEDDLDATYQAVYDLDPKVVVTGHGPVGTVEDVKALKTYMAELQAGVEAGIAAGLSLEEIKATVLLEAYADWDNYETRRPQNIEGMYRYLTAD